MVGRRTGTAAAAGTGCASQPRAAQDGAPAPKHIAFFGFAKANSYATATFTGIKQYTKAHSASARSIDGNFDAQTQARHSVAGKPLAFVANGASKQAVDAVKQHRWFAACCLPLIMGAKAAELGLD
ncbi:hypothetical protein [Kitasatospora sp. NPDC085879]|uniref:hypothetical protein n=1 Tax=Kitasatospora sp. NPDC085879 TaxID=3154769 RepID=UPI00343418A0